MDATPNRVLFSGVSLFAGCGGSDIGLRDACIEPIWANELDPTACGLYEQVTRSSVIHQGDIRKIRQFPKGRHSSWVLPVPGV